MSNNLPAFAMNGITVLTTPFTNSSPVSYVPARTSSTTFVKPFNIPESISSVCSLFNISTISSFNSSTLRFKFNLFSSFCNSVTKVVMSLTS